MRCHFIFSWCHFIILMSLQIYRKRECLAIGSKVCATAVEMWRYVSSIVFGPNQNWDSNYSPGCCASFCFWCLNYKTAENLGKSGILYTILGCIVPCIPIMLARTEARERYNIEVRRGEERQGGSWRSYHCLQGDQMGDAVASCCCTSCVMCQASSRFAAFSQLSQNRFYHWVTVIVLDSCY